MWSDFNGGASGDLLDLWAGVKRVPLATALDEARAWLGIERPALQRPVERTWTRPPKPQCQKPQARVLDYLRADRNLPDAVIARYRIGEQGDEMGFPLLQIGRAPVRTP